MTDKVIPAICENDEVFILKIIKVYFYLALSNFEFL